MWGILVPGTPCVNISDDPCLFRFPRVRKFLITHIIGLIIVDCMVTSHLLTLIVINF